MIKVPSYIELKDSTYFRRRTGLCDNVWRWAVQVSRLTVLRGYSCRFEDFLHAKGYDLAYPIGAGGYAYSNAKGKTVDRNRQLYWDKSKLYVGMQDALRHNLYNQYRVWLVKQLPEYFHL